jgi:hypothetical protein
VYNLNERLKWLRADVDMKTERTRTGVGQSVHGYCDYYFLCLMKLFHLPALLDRERSDSIAKRFFCNTESNAVSWYRVFIYVGDLRCEYDKAVQITLSLTKCRRRYFPNSGPVSPTCICWIIDCAVIHKIQHSHWGEILIISPVET